VADHRRLADDDAGAVVDEEPFIDLSAGMDVDTGQRVSDLGDDPRQQRRAEPVEFMRQAMAHDRGDAGKAEDDLVNALRRRIVRVSRADVYVEGGAYLRQRTGNKRVISPADRPLALAGSRAFLLLERQRQFDLLLERGQRPCKRPSHKRVGVRASSPGGPKCRGRAPK